MLETAPKSVHGKEAAPRQTKSIESTSIERLKRSLLEGISPENALQRCEIFDRETNQLSEKDRYELDFSWSDQEVSRLLDAYSQTEGEGDGAYGFPSQFPPWFFTTRQKRGGEKRDGMSERVVNWLTQKIATDQAIPGHAQEVFSVWAQDIQMADSERVVSLFLADKDNPGLLSSRLSSEIVGGLAFHGEGISKHMLKETRSKGIGYPRLNTIVEILSGIANLRDNVGYEDSAGAAMPALQELRKNTPNYFIQKKIDVALAGPFDEIGLPEKKSLLKLEIDEEICSELEGDGLIDLSKYRSIDEIRAGVEGWSDDAVARAISLLADKSPGYAEWHKRITLNNRFNDESIKSSYDILPRGEYRRRDLEQCTYTRLSTRHAAIYDTEGRINRVFYLDQKTEQEAQEIQDKFGSLKEGHLKFFKEKILRGIASGSFDDIATLLYVAPYMPERIRELCDGIIGNNTELQPGKLHKMSDFDEFVQAHRKSLEPLFSAHKKEIEAAAQAIEDLSVKRQDFFAERNEGYKSDDIDQLNFFSGMLQTPPNRTDKPIYTLYYYILMRDRLPKELAESFEKEFGITIASGSERFTLDDLLIADLPRLQGIMSFKDSSPNHIREAARSLQSSVDSLHEDLSEKKTKPETTTLKKILLESGVDESVCTEEYVSAYRALMEPDMRAQIENEFHIALADYPVRTQAAFLNVLATSGTFGVQQIKDILESNDKDTRADIMTAFLAAEKEDPILAIEHITTLLEYKEVGMPIIKKVSEFLRSVDTIESSLKELSTQEVDRQVVGTAAKLISAKVVPLISKFYSKLWEQGRLSELAGGEYQYEQYFGSSSGEASGARLEQTRAAQLRETQEIVAKEIDALEKDTLLFFAGLAALRKEHIPVSLEDAKNVSFESCSTESLTDKKNSAMQTMYARNYQTKPRLQAALIKSFGEVLNDNSGKQRFFLFEHKNELQGFYRLEEQEPHQLYFGSFNVNPSYTGYRLGEVMLMHSLEPQAKENIIIADCNREAPIAGHYIESGFIGVDAYSFEEDESLHIVRNDSKRNELLTSAAWTPEEISAMGEVGKVVEKESGKFLVATFPRERLKDIPFDLLHNEGGQERYVLSRYLFGDVKNNKTVCAVFERVSAEALKQFEQEIVSQ
jgi:uncharacterized protein (DUF2132 family)